jgi:S-adenosylmethionine:tRNA ribosyltransferase-isomerase
VETREPAYPISQLDYALPEELIAQTPLSERDASRLLVVKRREDALEHRAFRELPDILPPDSLVVINESRVMNSRFHCTREGTGGKVEVLITCVLHDGTAECLTQARGHLLAGEMLIFKDGISFELLRPAAEGKAGIVCFVQNGEEAGPARIGEILRLGEQPLPPYIKAPLAEPERYQTTYARELGSAAAPTAGLHFSARTFAELEARGISIARITLHVGTATFLPIRTDDAAQHRLSPEPYSITPQDFRTMLAAKLAGRPIAAVGTTSLRTLEWVFADWRGQCRCINLFTPEDVAAAPDAMLRDFFRLEGSTALYVLPGHRFKFVDALLTNFHLPKTTLLALVYAFGGRDLVRRAYDEAVKLRYRFYSLGDAMLII